MNRLKYPLFICLMLTVLAALFLRTGVAEAASLSCGAWSVAPSLNPSSTDNSLTSVAAVSSNNVWVVGTYQSNSQPYLYQTLVERWNGTKWGMVKSPGISSANNSLQSVTHVPGTNQLWAVGSYVKRTSQTLIEHWDGAHWSIVKSPNVGSLNNALTGVAALSATNVWAVGDYENPQYQHQTLVEHWNGTNWQVVKSPSAPSADNALNAIAALSATSIWAVGDYYTASKGYQALIEQWNGTNWQIVKSPVVSGSSLNGIAAIPGTNQLWAIGSNGQTLIERWDGSSWHVVSSPGGGQFTSLFGVVAISASNAWTVGIEQTGEVSYNTLIEHWNGTRWQVFPSPSPGFSAGLYGITRVASTSQLWAAGVANGTLIEHYC